MSGSQLSFRYLRTAGGLGLGIASVGVAGYVFVVVAVRALPTQQAQSVTTFYMIVNILATGVFLGVEHVVCRWERQRREGRSSTSVCKLALRIAGLVAAISVLLLAAAPSLIRTLFFGDSGLWLACLVGLLFAAGMHAIRGLLSGSGKLWGYCAMLFAEGTTRLLGCVLLIVIETGAAWYGWAFVAGSGMSAMTGLYWLLRRDSTAVVSARVRDAGENDRVLTVVVSCLSTQLLLNLPAVVVSAANSQDASWFAYAVLLSRIPMFLFSPVPSILVASFVSAASISQVAVGARLRAALSVTWLLGALGALGCALGGPWSLSVFLGREDLVSPLVLGLLGIGAALVMVAQVFQSAVVAMGRSAIAVFAWLGGVVVLAGSLALPLDPVVRAVIGQLVGPLLVVLVMSSLVREVVKENSCIKGMPQVSGANT